MRHNLLFFTGGFIAGACCLWGANHYLTADERTMANLYPASIGLTVSHDIRVLNAIQSNDLEQANRLLKQEIDSSVNTLIGLEKSIKLDEQSREAIRLGQNATKVK
jgi:hypothetical protein